MMGRRRRRGYEWWRADELPQSMIRLAERRCQFMLESLSMLDFDLKRLVVSAYLQGINDAAAVAFKNGFVPEEMFKDLGAGI